MTKPLPRRQRAKPSFTERRLLLSGKPYALPYLARGQWAARLWREFGPDIVERYASRRLFSRPIHFWLRDRAHDPRRPGESEFDYLTRHPELLTESERRRLASWDNTGSRRGGHSGSPHRQSEPRASGHASRARSSAVTGNAGCSDDFRGPFTHAFSRIPTSCRFMSF